MGENFRRLRAHALGDGAYARRLWQNAAGDRELGANEYGIADAANILYTIGEFPTGEKREQLCAALVLAGEVSLDWQRAYFSWIRKNTDPTYGMSRACHTRFDCTKKCIAKVSSDAALILGARSARRLNSFFLLRCLPRAFRGKPMPPITYSVLKKPLTYLIHSFLSLPDKTSRSAFTMVFPSSSRINEYCTPPPCIIFGILHML